MLITEEKKKVKKKRGRGRPKKRGPKKKKKYISKKPKVKKNIKFDYKIVAVSNGRQVGYFGQYFSIEGAYETFKELQKENEKVLFRRKLINTGSLKNSRDEYLLLKKNRDGSLKNTKLRNEFGKLIEQVSSNPKWIIYDKCERYVEETFWIYGMCPKSERKTIQWIYDNIAIGKLYDDYSIERVILYKNKIIIKHDDATMDIIFCKNTSDSLRFYNLFQELCKRNKQIFFLGSYDKISDRRRELEQEIIEYTGWTKTKVQRDSTRA